MQDGRRFNPQAPPVQPPGAMAAPGTQPQALAPYQGGGMPATPQVDPLAEAMAAHAKAAIEAQFAIAQARPRREHVSRQAFIEECGRPSFAAVSRFSRPVGGGEVAEGPTIRFVEAALRCWGNVYQDVQTIRDDDDKRIVAVTVVDLETNLRFGKTITIGKSVWRRNPRGRNVIKKKHNSRGQETYLVEADEDEVFTKEAAQVSKTIRQLGLRILPGDFVEEGMGQCLDTLARADAQDPKAAIKRVVDAFWRDLRVPAEDLAEYVGDDLARLTPDDLLDLRGVYAAIRDGQVRWRDVMADLRGEGDGEASTTLNKSIQSKRERREAAKKAAEAEVAEAAKKKADGSGDKPAAKKKKAKKPKKPPKATKAQQEKLAEIPIAFLVEHSDGAVAKDGDTSKLDKEQAGTLIDVWEADGQTWADEQTQNAEGPPEGPPVDEEKGDDRESARGEGDALWGMPVEFVKQQCGGVLPDPDDVTQEDIDAMREAWMEAPENPQGHQGEMDF